MFVSLVNYNRHLVSVHSSKNVDVCAICKQQVNNRNKAEVDFNHYHEHGISFFHCLHCKFGCSTADVMQSHARDMHPTKLPYALVRLVNGTNSSEEKAKIVRLHTKTSEKLLCCSQFTESQINFMNPSLTEYLNNVNSVPADDDPALINSNNYNTILGIIVEETALIERNHHIEASEHVLKAQISSVKPQNPLIVNSPSKNASSLQILSVSSGSEIFSDHETSIQSEIDLAAKTLIKGTGISFDELYRCSNCPDTQLEEDNFKVHLAVHGNEFNPKCYHCNETFVSNEQLKEHIESHGSHRFFCYFCDKTSATQSIMLNHYEISHNINIIHYFPLNPNKDNFSKDMFVVCPRDVTTINDFGIKLMGRHSSLMTSKKVYSRNEIDMLPTTPIFYDDVQCSHCPYKTKVRSNMYRHLSSGICIEQNNTQSEMAAVNPVPCLNSSERHSDKMKNLAASSNTIDNSSPVHQQFIAAEERFKCGACQYQSHTPDMLRCHIETLHASDSEYNCPHCRSDLANNEPIDANQILNHLRYHDTKLFQCPTCKAVHYLKQHIDKHIADLHPNSKAKTITLTREKNKTIVSQPSTNTFKWKCNLCPKSIFDSKQLMKAHLRHGHRLEYQYQCSICLGLQSDFKTTIRDHLVSEHRENGMSKIKANYERVESDVDNTPIWRRDDPTRVSVMIKF